MREVSEFVVGQSYFLLTYLDENLTLPDIKTLIFVGINANQDADKSKTSWCFVKPDEFIECDSNIEKILAKKPLMLRFEKDTLSALRDWRGLISELSENYEALQSGTIFN